MFDFSDVQAANKDEQIRAYAIEKAVELASFNESSDADIVVRRAEIIEKYIKTGVTSP